MKRMVRLIQVLFPLAFLAAGLGYALYIHEGYARGQREYANLQDEYTYTVGSDYGEKAQDQDEETEAFNRNDIRKTEEEDTMRGKRMWKPLIAKIPEDAPERLAVSREDLLEKNEDVKAWISVPAVEISYPVLQAADNDFYLHRNIDKEYLFAGSVFLDAANNASFMNYNTIIYGHNMRDGSMFARLREFLNVETDKKCRYFWIMTPEADMLYEIFSVHYAAVGSDTFMIRFQDYDAYEGWLKNMAGMSAAGTTVIPETQDRIVTLSTCTEDSAKRMTVQGKLIWKGSPYGQKQNNTEAQGAA